MGTESGGNALEHATFAHALDSLKQDGSNILLVGDSSSVAHRSGCERLLGEEGDQSRYRLFVVTEESCCSRGWAATHEDETDRYQYHEQGSKPDDADPTTKVIRRIADDTDETTTPSVDESVVGTEMLNILGTEVIDTINEFDDAANGLGPSELRLCVDSLVPLLTDHSSENVFRLLHVLTLRVKQSSGMGHYHLPIDADHDAVNLLEPLFDAVVEVRNDDGVIEQRWTLRDQRTTSEWLPL